MTGTPAVPRSLAYMLDSSSNIGTDALMMDLVLEPSFFDGLIITEHLL